MGSVVKKRPINVINADVLKRVVTRISRERNSINSRINAIDEMITRERTENPASARSKLSDLSKKREALVIAETKPNYADKEFREYSIPYVEHLAIQLEMERNSLIGRIRRNQASIKELEGAIRELDTEWTKGLNAIGIFDREIHGDSKKRRYTQLSKKYRELCSQYN